MENLDKRKVEDKEKLNLTFLQYLKLSSKKYIYVICLVFLVWLIAAVLN